MLTTGGSSSQEVVAQSDKMTQGEIRFTNNLETKITDVEVTAKFLEMFLMFHLSKQKMVL